MLTLFYLHLGILGRIKSVLREKTVKEKKFRSPGIVKAVNFISS